MAKRTATNRAASPKVRKRIEERAYEIYLQRPVHEGDAVSDWLQAEKEIKRKKKARA